MNNLLIAQSGGPTSAINATIAGAISCAFSSKKVDHVYGAINGIQGVFEEKFVDLKEKLESEKDFRMLCQTPSAALGSCRFKLGDLKKDKEQFETIIKIFRKHDIKYFIYTGGNDSMDSVDKLSAYCKENGIDDIVVVGAPKTIDNDLTEIDHCPGFGSAAKYIATTFAELERDCHVYDTKAVTIVEVMGRNAGWIALESGIAGSADVILLPEIPYDIKKIEEKVRQREAEGRNFTIIVVAEGAKPKDGDVVVSKIVSDSPDPIRLGGIGNKLADDLEKLIKDHEVRCTVLGHVQRGGNTCTYDRILSTRYGVAAMELIIEGKFGQMVCLKGDTITNDTLENVIGQNTKKVNPEGELVQVAKKIGITFAE